MEETVSFCGRVLTVSDLDLVRHIIGDFPGLSQAELAYRRKPEEIARAFAAAMA